MDCCFRPRRNPMNSQSSSEEDLSAVTRERRKYPRPEDLRTLHSISEKGFYQNVFEVGRDEFFYTIDSVDGPATSILNMATLNRTILHLMHYDLVKQVNGMYRTYENPDEQGGKAGFPGVQHGVRRGSASAHSEVTEGPINQELPASDEQNRNHVGSGAMDDEGPSEDQIVAPTIHTADPDAEVARINDPAAPDEEPVNPNPLGGEPDSRNAEKEPVSSGSQAVASNMEADSSDSPETTGGQTLGEETKVRAAQPQNPSQVVEGVQYIGTGRSNMSHAFLRHVTTASNSPSRPADSEAGKDDPPTDDVLAVSQSLDRYCSAVRNMDYMQSCASRGLLNDPFKINSEWFLQRDALCADGFLGSRLRSYQRLPDCLDHATPRLIGESRSWAIKHLNRHRMVKRVVYALSGGLALIVPMLLMVYIPGTTASVTTTCAFVTSFALAVAVSSDLKPHEVLAVTSAYAAVLVVFVGLQVEGIH